MWKILTKTLCSDMFSKKKPIKIPRTFLYCKLIKRFMARVTFTYLQTIKFFMLECTLSLMINNRNPQFYNCTLLLYLMWYCSIVEIPLRFIWHKTTACAQSSWQAKRTPQIFEGESFLAFFCPPPYTVAVYVWFCP